LEGTACRGSALTVLYYREGVLAYDPVLTDLDVR
jgi:hypothetical protein